MTKIMFRIVFQRAENHSRQLNRQKLLFANINDLTGSHESFKSGRSQIRMNDHVIFCRVADKNGAIAVKTNG